MGRSWIRLKYFRMSTSMLGNVFRSANLLNIIKSPYMGLTDICVRYASKKSGSTSKNKTRRAVGKSRGPKKFNGDWVEKGMILYRQLGLHYYPGENVGCGRDCTLFALEPGNVIITTETLSPRPESPLYAAVKGGRVVNKRFYNIIPEEQKALFKLVSQT